MIIIPARIGSSRFPNKVLADIGGIPMVVRTAKAVQDIDNVVIATDSQEVIDIANSHGIEAVLTSDKHQSGTDRIYEAVQKLNLNENEIIINVPLALKIMTTGFIWPISAWQDFVSSDLVAADKDVTVSPR